MSARAWRGMGSPSLVSTASQLLAFDRRTCIALGILAQTPVNLGGKTILFDFMVIEDPLDFNMLLGCDYVYSMEVVVSTFFPMMYFNHGEEIVTIDQLDFLNPSPNATRDQVFPLLIPSVSIDTTPPQVSYVASCPLRLIATKKHPMFSCLPSRGLVPVVDHVSHPIQIVGPSLHLSIRLKF